MSGFLIFVGLLGVVLGLIGIVKGGVRKLHLEGRKSSAKLAGWCPRLSRPQRLSAKAPPERTRQAADARGVAGAIAATSYVEQACRPPVRL